MKIGALTGAVLIALGAWIAWRGPRADPELSMTAADLFEPASKSGATSAKDRGALPPDLAPKGWVEKSVSTFDSNNLYEKIDGREGYYKGFGFVRLDFASIADASTPERYFDIELFDLGSASNALGAMNGEVPEGGHAEMNNGAMVFVGRNSILLARGKLYARLIGADESEPVRAALAATRDRLLATLPAASDLPLGMQLFSAILGLPADRVAYEAENAFSLGFAKDVHLGRLPDDTELFAVKGESAEAAKVLAGKYIEGFKEYGEDGGASDGISWVRDRYLSTIAGASSEGIYVIGVRGAPDKTKAAEAIARLRKAVSSL